jgi:hypothetical protein
MMVYGSLVIGYIYEIYAILALSSFGPNDANLAVLNHCAWVSRSLLSEYAKEVEQSYKSGGIRRRRD